MGVRFQSHAGSIEARVIAVGGGALLLGFQSHAGSIEAHLPVLQPLIQQVFQSHAGSIEATDVENLLDRITTVSIPRWFD